MLKKHLQKILLLFIALGITSLQATQLPPGKGDEEGKNNTEEKPKQEELLSYYNYTLRYNKKKINNTVDSEDLEDQKEYFRDNNITKKIKDKKGLIFFMLIASNKETNTLNKFFFFNRDPNKEQEAIKRVNKFYGCHVISFTKPKLSPHIIVQVLGWMEQNDSIYPPQFIYANAPLCITCHAIVSNLFNLKVPKDAEKGCNGAKKLELANICHLAQHYLDSRFTVALAQKILLPQVTYAHKNELRKVEHKLDHIKKKMKKHLLGNRFMGHTNGIQSLVITDDNKYIVSGGRDSTIRICQLGTGKELPYSPLKGHTDSVMSVALTKDNKYIISGGRGDNTIRIWDFKTGKELPYSPLKGHTSDVLSVAITKDNQYIVSGSLDSTIRIWDFNTGAALSYSPLNGHKYSVDSVAISSENAYIVSGGGDKTIRIWDFKTGKELGYSPLRGHNGTVYSVAISSDNSYVVSGSSDRTIRIWDLKTGKELGYSPLTGHTSLVESVVITKDNRYVVSGSGGNAIRIWGLKTGKELDYSPLTGHTGYVMSVAVSNDNKYIVSGSQDKTIRIWDTSLFNELMKELNRDQDEHKEKQKEEDNNEHKEDNEVFDID